jgi:hypothetical protein
MRNNSNKRCGENQNTHFTFSFLTWPSSFCNDIEDEEKNNNKSPLPSKNQAVR